MRTNPLILIALFVLAVPSGASTARADDTLSCSIVSAQGGASSSGVLFNQVNCLSWCDSYIANPTLPGRDSMNQCVWGTDILKAYPPQAASNPAPTTTVIVSEVQYVPYQGPVVTSVPVKSGWPWATANTVTRPMVTTHAEIPNSEFRLNGSL